MTKPPYSCAKCDDCTDSYSIVVAEGISFVFCKPCGELLEDHHRMSVREFLGPRKETWIPAKMKHAKRARSYGIGVWKK